MRIPFGDSYMILERQADIASIRRNKSESLSDLDIITQIHEFVKSLNAQDRTVAIAIPDITRPKIPNVLLEELIKELKKKGSKDIILIIATGLHPPLESYMEIISSKIHEMKVNITFHNPNNDISYLGVTSKGTPVFVNKRFLKADVKISIGVVEPHQFAGFSGGYKGILIGLGGKETICKNHSMMISPNAKLGVLKGNPVREDIEEAAKFIKNVFFINLILDSKNRLIKVFWGSAESYKKAVEYIKKTSGVSVKKKYDVVITSPGGFPRDIDLYQAQKALTVAEFFCKPSGLIILVAECRLGFGEKRYVKLLKAAESPEDVLNNFNFENFEVGPHKAVLFARTLTRFNVRIISKIPDEEFKDMFMKSFSNLYEALEDIPPDREILVIPNALQILPIEN